MREMLSVALSKRIGQVLTLELAKEIACEADVNPDLSIDPMRFAPEQSGRYTFQCEQLSIDAQALRQHRANYLYETSDIGVIRTNWSALLQRQRDGRMVIFTARTLDERTLAASVWLNLSMDVDTQALSVSDDLVYVSQDHRDGLLGVQILQFAERCIFALGVREASFHFRLDNGADRMAKYLGYTSVSTRFKKTHNGDPFAAVPTRHEGVFNGSVA